MQLGFTIIVKEEKEYLLSEKDSKKVIDTAVKIAKIRKDYPAKENDFSFYLQYAIQLLLDTDEIEGVLADSETDEELTSVWKQIE